MSTPAEQERLHRFFELAAAAVAILDRSGTVLYFSPSLTRMLGYDITDIPHLEDWWSRAYPDPDYRHERRAAWEARLATALGESPSVIGRASRVRCKDGSFLWLESHVSFSAEEIFVLLVDANVRKQAEAAHEAARVAAEQLARMKSEFLANMSHEIRTPLNGMLGLAQIGYKESYGRGKAQDRFARILESGQLLLAIVNDILDFSKIEAGRMTVERVPISPRRVAEESMALFTERAVAKGLTLQVEFDENLPTACLCDPTRLAQILINLLSNAVKFTSHGTVSLQARRVGDSLAFVVRDTGIGMTREQLGRLYDPFVQADTSTTRKYGGTGLGMAITQRLVALLGGILQVDSVPGLGSRFEVLLPYRETVLPPVTNHLPERREDGRHLQDLRILVAEDNDINRLVLEDLLTGEGAVAVLVENGRLAVEAVKNHPDGFDLVLMDVQMPEMDGLEATQRILAIVPQLPIIGQTAHAFPEDHERCRAAGMIDTLSKPLTHSTLVAKVLHHARRSGGIVPALDMSPTERAAEVPSIDWVAFEERYADRPALIGKLINAALKSLLGLPDEIRAASIAGDRERIIFIAHSVKGAAGQLSALSVAELARSTELAARSGEPDLPVLAGDLADALGGLCEELRRRSAKSGA